MSPEKRFLIILAVVSLVVCIGINAAFGPPGLSGEYREQYKAEHDRYLEITKSNAYKRAVERPELRGPGTEMAPAGLQAQMDFVETYTSKDLFKAEQARIAKYDLAFGFFNAAIVVVLALYFGRKPLLDFLDNGIAELRRKVRQAEDARIAAEERKRAAEERMAGLAQESRRVGRETQERLGRELAELEEASQHNLQLMEADLADRRKEVGKEAEMALKRELVEAMVEEIEVWYRKVLAEGGADSEAHQGDLMDRVAGDLEKRA